MAKPKQDKTIELDPKQKVHAGQWQRVMYNRRNPLTIHVGDIGEQLELKIGENLLIPAMWEKAQLRTVIKNYLKAGFLVEKGLVPNDWKVRTNEGAGAA